MNNALLELFDEYENDAQKVENKKPGRKKKTPENKPEPNKSELQKEKEKKLIKKEEDLIKDKILELVPEDIEENSISDFLDDFDKELDLDSINGTAKNKEAKSNKQDKIKIKIKQKHEPKQSNVDTKELSFDEFMAMAEKEYNEKEAAKKKEELEKTIQKENKNINENNNEEDFEDIFPEFSTNEINEEKSNIKEHESEELSIEEMIERSETYFKDEWIEYYEKANKSKKNNIYQSKLKRGLFRINKDHQIEWLPEHSTKGKSSLDLLREKWQ